MIDTVETFANDLQLSYVVERAISFDYDKLQPLWSVPVQWKITLRRRAGYGSTHGIYLHPGLQITTKKDLIETFLHEVGHAMEGFIYGRYGHSYNWVEQMIRLGQVPKRTHSIMSCMTKYIAQTTPVDIQKFIGSS